MAFYFEVSPKGIYSEIRHPIYSADILLAIGIFFLFPTLKVLFCVFWVIIVLILWMKLEEKSLSDKFKHKYILYKKKVPMMFPRFFK